MGEIVVAERARRGVRALGGVWAAGKYAKEIKKRAVKKETDSSESRAIRPKRRAKNEVKRQRTEIVASKPVANEMKSKSYGAKKRNG